MTTRRYLAFFFVPCVVLLPVRLVAQSEGIERAAQPAPKLEISRVAVEPKELSTPGRDSVTVMFSVSAPCRAVLRISDRWRRLVRTVDLGQLDAGEHSAAWDGRDDTGMLCRGNRFLYTLTARDERRNTVIHDPAEQGAGLEVRPRKFTFDREIGRITYVLPKSAIGPPANCLYHRQLRNRSIVS